MRAEFQALNATVVGISPDRSDRLNEFDEMHTLGFPLLADPKKTVAGQFGVKRFGPLPIARVTFVIGQDRRVLGVVKSEMNFNGHADESLKILTAAAE